MVFKMCNSHWGNYFDASVHAISNLFRSILTQCQVFYVGSSVGICTSLYHLGLSSNGRKV
eukprot:scaffold75484_cov44-Cyclotella_meneghiniana.AAC.6